MRELREAKRVEALDHMREQVASGSLRIRQMTAEERSRYAPRARPTPFRRERPRS
jgi:hypothetical protein